MKWEHIAAEKRIDVRKCDICGKPMIDGYCVGDGEQYYCSDECLAMVFTEDEWELVYQTDGGYYTEWYDEYDEDEMDIICNEWLPMWKEENGQYREEKTMNAPYFTFLNDYNSDTIMGVIMSTDTTPEDIRNIVQEVKNEYPSDWAWVDILMRLPSDCYVYDRDPYNTVQI